MDGLLVIDKPEGPTSHDVVARMRRVLRERRIGHTGTLDPRATGVLPLLVGRATRLAQFMSGSDKRYRAVIRLGVRTDTGDADGRPVGDPYAGPLPSAEAIDRAIERFRGSFLQRPPAFSAKKIAGRRSYVLARSARNGAGASHSAAAMPEPVRVTVHSITVTDAERDRLTLDVHCSAGFYVRSLADDLGQHLGTGAHLDALRRTHSGDFTLADAVTLEAAEAATGTDLERRIIALRQILPALAAVRLTPEAVRSAMHGRDIDPAACERVAARDRDPVPSTYVRLLDPSGDLVGIGEPSKTPGLLHPSVVLM